MRGHGRRAGAGLPLDAAGDGAGGRRGARRDHPARAPRRALRRLPRRRHRQGHRRAADHRHDVGHGRREPPPCARRGGPVVPPAHRGDGRPACRSCGAWARTRRSGRPACSAATCAWPSTWRRPRTRRPGRCATGGRRWPGSSPPPRTPSVPVPSTSTSPSPSRWPPTAPTTGPRTSTAGPTAGRGPRTPASSAGMSTPLDDVLDALLDDERVPARGIVVLGDHDGTEAVELIDELADALGWPVIAEPSGNGAGCSTALSHGPLLLADPAFAEAHVPEIVVTVGRVGLNRSVLRMIGRAGLHVAVDTQPEWSDPTRTADVVVASVPLAPTEAEIDEAWLESWQRADVLAAAAVETALFLPDDGLTGHARRPHHRDGRAGRRPAVRRALVVRAPRRVLRRQHRPGRRHPRQPRHLRHRRLRLHRVGCGDGAAAQRRSGGPGPDGRPDLPLRQQRPARAPPRRTGPTSSSSCRTTTAAASSPRSSRGRPSMRRRSSACSASRWASTSRRSPRRWGSRW